MGDNLTLISSDGEDDLQEILNKKIDWLGK